MFAFGWESDIVFIINILQKCLKFNITMIKFTSKDTEHIFFSSFNILNNGFSIIVIYNKISENVLLKQNNRIICCPRSSVLYHGKLAVIK